MLALLACLSIQAQNQAGTLPKYSLKQELDLSRKENIPLDYKDLEPNPPVRQEDNALPIYQKAMKMFDAWLPAHPFNRALPPDDFDYAYSQPAEVVRQSNEKFKEMKPLLDVIEQAASKPTCYFKPQFMAGVRMPPVMQFAYFKTFTKIECKAANLSAQARDCEGAFKHLSFANQIAKHVEADPEIISFLVGFACEAIICRSLQYVIDSNPTPDTLERADNFVLSMPGIKGFAHDVAGEVPGSRHWLEMIKKSLRGIAQLATNDESEKVGRAEEASLRRALANPNFEAILIHTLRRSVEVMPTGDEDITESFKRSASVALERNSLPSDIKIGINAITGIFDNGALTLVGAAAKSIARRRVALTAIRLLKDYRNTDFPSTLPNYGEESTDPFTDKPFSYEKTSKGFFIYSLYPPEPGKTEKRYHAWFRYPDAK